MYVVRRAFRNFGLMMAPGSVVEPAAIKRFKSRLIEGRIVEVNEQNFDKWCEYFKVRAGVTLELPAEKPVDENRAEEQAEEVTEKPVVVKASPVVKAVVK